MIDTEFPDFIQVERFGEDHWSTLAYVETVCVDRGGIIQPEKMRCNARRHRTFAHSLCFVSTKEYPTRLRDGELPKHDDWDCLQDLAEAGFLVIAEDDVVPSKRINVNPSFNYSSAFPGLTCRVEMTSKGFGMAMQLRQHRANGGKWRDFAPENGTHESEDDASLSLLRGAD